MKWRPLAPRTLFARLMLIWLAGLAVVLGTSFWLFLGERERFDRDVVLEGVARELAAVSDAVEGLPELERASYLETQRHRRLRLVLDGPPADATPVSHRGRLTETFGRAQPDRPVQLYAQPAQSAQGTQNARGNQGEGPQFRLYAVVTLSDDSQLTARIPHLPRTPDRNPASPARMLAALAALVAGIGLLAWMAVRIATRPLSRLAEAARQIGEDPEHGRVPTDGPAEVTQAAGAFLQMQQRIREHIAERTRLLAAISHDLQTPITRLRLRAEQVEDENLRGRIQTDLDDMQLLVREGLDYARSLESGEKPQALDVAALLESLSEDARELGWDVECGTLAATRCIVRPQALRRALWNLIENGVKFGDRLHITLQDDGTAARILLQDEGPGLPEQELERVFEPFYRTESSRSRATGGTGLGLAIARNLLRVQGGELTLSNAPEGGLLARVSLPRS